MSGVLVGRVVAIAGAGGGSGPSVAAALAAAGAGVALAGRDRDRLDAVAAQLALAPERVDVHVVDLVDEAASRAWADGLRERFGRVDILLDAVGGGMIIDNVDNQIKGLSVDEWTKMVKFNMLTCFVFSR